MASESKVDLRRCFVLLEKCPPDSNGNSALWNEVAGFDVQHASSGMQNMTSPRMEDMTSKILSITGHDVSCTSSAGSGMNGTVGSPAVNGTISSSTVNDMIVSSAGGGLKGTTVSSAIGGAYASSGSNGVTGKLSSDVIHKSSSNYDMYADIVSSDSEEDEAAVLERFMKKQLARLEAEKKSSRNMPLTIRFNGDDMPMVTPLRSRSVAPLTSPCDNVKFDDVTPAGNVTPSKNDRPSSNVTRVASDDTQVVSSGSAPAGQRGQTHERQPQSSDVSNNNIGCNLETQVTSVGTVAGQSSYALCKEEPQASDDFGGDSVENGASTFDVPLPDMQTRIQVTVAQVSSEGVNIKEEYEVDGQTQENNAGVQNQRNTCAANNVNVTGGNTSTQNGKDQVPTVACKTENDVTPSQANTDVTSGHNSDVTSGQNGADATGVQDDSNRCKNDVTTPECKEEPDDVDSPVSKPTDEEMSRKNEIVPCYVRLVKLSPELLMKAATENVVNEQSVYMSDADADASDAESETSLADSDTTLPASPFGRTTRAVKSGNSAKTERANCGSRGDSAFDTEEEDLGRVSVKRRGAKRKISETEEDESEEDDDEREREDDGGGRAVYRGKERGNRGGYRDNCRGYISRSSNARTCVRGSRDGTSEEDEGHRSRSKKRCPERRLSEISLETNGSDRGDRASTAESGSEYGGEQSQISDVDPDGKTHKCKRCGAGFDELEAFERHVRIHTHQKPYECKVCGMAFSQRTTLSYHMRAHGKRNSESKLCKFCWATVTDPVSPTCPQCTAKLQEPCKNCGGQLTEPHSSICHSCTTSPHHSSCRNCGADVFDPDNPLCQKCTGSVEKSCQKCGVILTSSQGPLCRKCVTEKPVEKLCPSCNKAITGSRCADCRPPEKILCKVCHENMTISVRAVCGRCQFRIQRRKQALQNRNGTGSSCVRRKSSDLANRRINGLQSTHEISDEFESPAEKRVHFDRTCNDYDDSKTRLGEENTETPVASETDDSDEKRLCPICGGSTASTGSIWQRCTCKDTPATPKQAQINSDAQKTLSPSGPRQKDSETFGPTSEDDEDNDEKEEDNAERTKKGCKSCGEPVSNSRNTYCDSCTLEYKKIRQGIVDDTPAQEQTAGKCLLVQVQKIPDAASAETVAREDEHVSDTNKASSDKDASDVEGTSDKVRRRCKLCRAFNFSVVCKKCRKGIGKRCSMCNNVLKNPSRSICHSCARMKSLKAKCRFCKLCDKRLTSTVRSICRECARERSVNPSYGNTGPRKSCSTCGLILKNPSRTICHSCARLKSVKRPRPVRNTQKSCATCGVGLSDPARTVCHGCARRKAWVEFRKRRAAVKAKESIKAQMAGFCRGCGGDTDQPPSHTGQAVPEICQQCKHNGVKCCATCGDVLKHQNRTICHSCARKKSLKYTSTDSTRTQLTSPSKNLNSSKTAAPEKSTKTHNCILCSAAISSGAMCDACKRKAVKGTLTCTDCGVTLPDGAKSTKCRQCELTVCKMCGDKVEDAESNPCRECLLSCAVEQPNRLFNCADQQQAEQTPGKAESHLLQKKTENVDGSALNTQKEIVPQQKSGDPSEANSVSVFGDANSSRPVSDEGASHSTKDASTLRLTSDRKHDEVNASRQAVDPKLAYATTDVNSSHFTKDTNFLRRSSDADHLRHARDTRTSRVSEDTSSGLFSCDRNSSPSDEDTYVSSIAKGTNSTRLTSDVSHELNSASPKNKKLIRPASDVLRKKNAASGTYKACKTCGEQLRNPNFSECENCVTVTNSRRRRRTTCEVCCQTIYNSYRNVCQKCTNEGKKKCKKCRTAVIMKARDVYCQDCQCESMRRPCQTCGQAVLHPKNAICVKCTSEHKKPCTMCGAVVTDPECTLCPKCTNITAYRRPCRRCGEHIKRLNTTICEKCKPPVKKPFPCPQCTRSFWTEQSLQLHSRAHIGVRPHKCPICTGVAFKRARHLREHMRTHTDERPYRCRLCSKRFRTSSNLRTHMFSHSDVKPFKCTLCDAVYKEPKSLHTHMRSHNGTHRAFTCSHCKATFTCVTALTSHLHRHQDLKLYDCSVCKASFGSASQLSVHMQYHHTDQTFKCDKCPSVFKTAKGLRDHNYTHRDKENPPFKCHICDKGFVRSRMLKDHMPVHSGNKDRPYQCKTCTASFVRPAELKNHMHIHTGDRPYKCKFCDKRFSRISHLAPHLRAHLGVRPYKCPEENCDAAFTSISHLLRHKQSHSNARPFRCSQCDKNFKCLSDLTCHLRRHSSFKPLKCPHCPKRFVMSHYRKSHLERHNPENKFECKICGYRFRAQGALTQHVTKAHMHSTKGKKRKEGEATSDREDGNTSSED